jgi:hypothetical protein
MNGLTVADGAIYQRLDLEEVLGVDLSGHEALKLVICQEMVDHIRARTLSGKDNQGRSFAPYSKSYRESEVYEAYGKSSKVNMELTGDMLASIDFETEGNQITLLFDSSEDELKAFGHHSGMEGHPTLAGKTPRREFFGISTGEIEEHILPKFQDDLDALKQDGSEMIDLATALGFNEQDAPKTWAEMLREYF